MVTFHYTYFYFTVLEETCDKISKCKETGGSCNSTKDKGIQCECGKDIEYDLDLGCKGTYILYSVRKNGLCRKISVIRPAVIRISKKANRYYEIKTIAVKNKQRKTSYLKSNCLYFIKVQFAWNYILYRR